MKDKYKKVPLVIRVPDEMADKLKEAAENNSMTVSGYLRVLIANDTCQVFVKPRTMSDANTSIVIPHSLAEKLSKEADKKKMGFGEYVKYLLENGTNQRNLDKKDKR